MSDTDTPTTTLLASWLSVRTDAQGVAMAVARSRQIIIVRMSAGYERRNLAGDPITHVLTCVENGEDRLSFDLTAPAAAHLAALLAP